MLFLALLVFAVPLAFAQNKRAMSRIGVLSLDSPDSYAGQLVRDRLTAALAQHGYLAGKNLVIEWRWADGHASELPSLAASLVDAHVDLIVAHTTAPIQAAKEASSKVPIVMLNANFPVETGLVPSLAHPGGNVTGSAYSSAETFSKQFQLLKQIVPHARHIAVLWATAETPPTMDRTLRTELDRAASTLDCLIDYYDVGGPADVPAALNRIARSGADAMWFSGAPGLRAQTDEITAFLLKQKLPSMSTIGSFTDRGGLAHYAPIVTSTFDVTADYIDRILKGARPGDLPVQLPTKYEFVINVKTAKAIGIDLPASLLARADRVVQ